MVTTPSGGPEVKPTHDRCHNHVIKHDPEMGGQLRKVETTIGHHDTWDSL
jgi:hypothetical protein